MIETLVTTPSTNAELAARLHRSEAVREGDWLVTDRQTAGRGRRGREWLGEQGNYLGSTVVHAAFGDPPLASLALVAGLAVHAVIAPLVPPPGHALLKWPNDLMIDGAKCAGILIEWVGNAAVIGIGVNLAWAPELPDRKSVALSNYGPVPDRNFFAEQLSAAFAVDLDRWRSFGLPAVVSRWLAAAHPLGTPLSVGEPGEAVLGGTFAGLNDDGALLLRLAGGTTRTIHAGEVRLSGEA